MRLSPFLFVGLTVGLEVSSTRALLQKDVQHCGSTEKGTVFFQPLDNQENVPDRYRLPTHNFSYKLEPKLSLPQCGLDVWTLTFPSPIVTPYPANNSVYAEYYRPRGPGPFPAAIILDITAGDQQLSRTIARQLAQNQIAGLFVQMAYYGPRRPPNGRLRLLSPNLVQTMDAVRQTVLDIRRAAAWLVSRREVDHAHLGIVGTSLGSLIAALAAEMEPRFKNVVVVLGGGGLVEAYYDYPPAASLRQALEALGVTKQKLIDLIAPVDPLTCAGNLKSRRVLIIAAAHDEIVPPKAAQALWRATGQQQIVWYDCGHYSSAYYFLPALAHVVKHLKAN
jgi:dienelactone hydrolase